MTNHLIANARHAMTTACFVASLMAATALPSDAQLVVHDPISYIQQFNTQINTAKTLIMTAKSAQSQLEQLQNLKTFTPGQWSQAKNNLLALAQVVAQNQNLSYNDSNLSTVFQQMYPDYKSPVNFSALSSTWYANTKSAILNALQVSGLATKQFADTDQILSDAQLKTENPESQGALIQAGNRIAALTVEQLQKMQQLEVARQGYETTFYQQQSSEHRAQAPIVSQWLSSGVVH